ncbi:MAG: hypothetical protein GX346_04505 [Clostridiales bacterium]|nr:hypothetical protein [Clostridiales bacterium]
MKGIIKKINSVFTRDIKLILLSLVIAFVLWVVINFNIYPIITERMSGIPLNADVTNFMLENNLEIVNDITTSVSAQIEGKRLTVNNLNAEDFTAHLDLSTVYGRGTFSAKVIIEPVDPTKDVNIVSISPDYIEINVEKNISKEFNVTADTSSLKITEGYKLGEAIAVPQQITLSGPADIINSIGSVVAKPVYDNTISQTMEVKADLIIYNQNGTRIENDSIKLPTDNISVHIPIFKQKSLPVTVTFKSVPAGFNLDTLEYEITPSVLEIASPDDSIDNLSEINIGVVHLNEVNLSESYSLPITLPEGYENLSGDTMAIIRFKYINYGRLNFNIKKENITIMNKPNNFDVSLVTNIIENVTVIGPSHTISSLSPNGDDLSATVNLLGTTLTEGTQEINATITLKKGTATCWVAGGPYKVTINAKKKTE